MSFSASAAAHGRHEIRNHPVGSPRLGGTLSNIVERVEIEAPAHRLEQESEQIMTEQTCSWESLKAEGGHLIDRLHDMVREGNVRRVVVEHDGRTIAEFTLTLGVVGVLFAPVLAAIGALVALLKDCTVHVERDKTPEAPRQDTVASAQ